MHLGRSISQRDDAGDRAVLPRRPPDSQAGSGLLPGGVRLAVLLPTPETERAGHDDEAGEEYSRCQQLDPFR